MGTKEVLNWVSHNHQLVLAVLIVCVIGLCNIVYSIFSGVRDIVYTIRGIKKKEKVNTENE